MDEISIDDVKALVARAECDGGMFIGFDLDTGKYEITSYGRNRRLCRKMRLIGDGIVNCINNGTIEI